MGMLLGNSSNVCVGEEEPNDDERFALISSLKKVSIFYNCHDMGKWNIWEGLLEVTQIILLSIK
jgi:hypothetical protein